MELSFKQWLFTLLVLISSRSSDGSSTWNISSEFGPKEDKLAESLLATLRDPTLRSMINVRIHIEAEIKFFRRNFEDTVERFCALNDRVTVELNSDESTSYNVHVRIYFIDSLSSLNSLERLVNHQRKVDRDFSAANQNYFIILPPDIPNPERVLKQIFHMCWENFIMNVNVFVEDANGFITLYTYYPFNEKRCSDSTPTVYNRFVNGSLERSRPTFPSKTKNFWQCPLKAVLWFENPFVILDSKNLSGFDAVILNLLAKEMNFSLEIIVSPDGKGVNYPNGSSSGGFGMLDERMGDFTMGGISMIKARHDFFAATSAYYMSNIWLSILILFTGKWICGVVWKWITTSVAPIWKHSLQLRLIPWLLTIFLLQSFYEGSIFTFLHNRPHKAPPNNLGETLDTGYKFIVWPQSFYFFSLMAEFDGKLIKVDGSKRDIFELFATLEGKYGLLVWLDILPQYNNDVSKFEKYYIVPEPILSIFPCVFLPKFSYLTKELNRKLGQMVTHGRIDKIIETHASIDNFMRKKTVDKTPRNLSLHELSGAFQFLGIFLCVDVSVFVTELFSRHNRTLQRIIEFFY